jgi:hypothetical protein
MRRPPSPGLGALAMSSIVHSRTYQSEPDRPATCPLAAALGTFDVRPQRPPAVIQTQCLARPPGTGNLPERPPGLACRLAAHLTLAQRHQLQGAPRPALYPVTLHKHIAFPFLCMPPPVSGACRADAEARPLAPLGTLNWGWPL